jgi:hypothetical protein
LSSLSSCSGDTNPLSKFCIKGKIRTDTADVVVVVVVVVVVA